MKKEIWKDIAGYEGLYQVSNFGRVKSIRFGKERILKPFKTGKGYLQVCLYKNNKRKKYYVHRLVAQTFLEIPEYLKQYIGTVYLHINHKDENRQDNFVNNIEWCDAKYNINYGTRTEKQSKTVVQYTLDGRFVREWASIAECGRNGFNQACVCMCCKGERKTHKGFIWKYK